MNEYDNPKKVKVKSKLKNLGKWVPLCCTVGSGASPSGGRGEGVFAP